MFEVKAQHALDLKKQEIAYYNLKLKVKANYDQEKETLSLMDEGLEAHQCAHVIDLGTKEQKQFIKYLFLVDNKLEYIPIKPA